MLDVFPRQDMTFFFVISCPTVGIGWGSGAYVDRSLEQKYWTSGVSYGDLVPCVMMDDGMTRQETFFFFPFACFHLQKRNQRGMELGSERERES